MGSIQNFNNNEQSLTHKIDFLVVKTNAIRTKDTQSSARGLTQREW